MDFLLDDLRYSLRALRRSPGFGTAALLTLAFGIGGTCAVFSVVNDTFLRPLPFAHESRLLRLRDQTRSPGGTVNAYNMVGKHFRQIAAQTRTLQAMSAQDGRNSTLTSADPPEHVDATLLSPGSLRTLGVQPMLGRDFIDGEQGVALISSSLWKRKFGGAADILGRTIGVDGQPLRIVGVMPPGYRFPYDAEVWMPFVPSDADPEDFAVFARMAPGVTLQQVRAEMNAIAAHIPRDERTNDGYGIEVNPLRESLLGSNERNAVALFAVMAFFLLLACANVAMLLLARAAGRQKELAIRSALGATAARQALRLFTESATLALLGGALGVWLAYYVAPLLTQLVPSNLSRQLGMQEAPYDWRVPLFAFGLSLFTALLAGVAPAVQATRTDVQGVLQGAAPGADPVRRKRVLSFFVAAQIALGVVLLSGAGLMIENFQLLAGHPTGMQHELLYSADLQLPASRYRDGPARLHFVERLQARLAALPGVTGAGTITVNPLRRATWTAPASAEGHEESAEMVNHRLITPGLLAAMGIPLLRGREFSAQEGAPVAIVSASLARRLWPGADAVGKRLRLARPGRQWMTVVGVAADVRDSGEVHDTWYLPYAQWADSGAAPEMAVMVRSALPEQPLANEVRRAIAAEDPLLSVSNFASMERVRHEELAPDRLGATTVSIFALLGLMLAALGTWGVVAYAVARREREMGIRLALGCSPRGVMRLLLREGLLRAAIGIAVGAAASVALGHVLGALLPEAGGSDPRVIAGIAMVLTVMTVIATLLPARRAARVDPLVSLRAE